MDSPLLHWPRWADRIPFVPRTALKAAFVSLAYGAVAGAVASMGSGGGRDTFDRLPFTAAMFAVAAAGAAQAWLWIPARVRARRWIAGWAGMTLALGIVAPLALLVEGSARGLVREPLLWLILGAGIVVGGPSLAWLFLPRKSDGGDAALPEARRRE